MWNPLTSKSCNSIIVRTFLREIFKEFELNWDLCLFTLVLCRVPNSRNWFIHFLCFSECLSLVVNLYAIVEGDCRSLRTYTYLVYLKVNHMILLCSASTENIEGFIPRLLSVFTTRDFGYYLLLFWITNNSQMIHSSSQDTWEDLNEVNKDYYWKLLVTVRAKCLLGIPESIVETSVVGSF